MVTMALLRSNGAVRFFRERQHGNTASIRPVGVFRRYGPAAVVPKPLKSRMQADDLEKLLTRQMPFGKYQGRLIADLPGNYLNWFARQGFPPGEIGRLLALMQELDHNGLKSLLEPLRRHSAGRQE